MGVGPGLLDTVTQAQIAKADFYVEWNWFYCTAHNDLLEYLVTTGIVGTVLKLMMYILPYKPSKPRVSHPLSPVKKCF